MSGGFDPREFLADYLAESSEHLAALEAGLLESERLAAAGAPPGEALINEMFRAIHTLKGMAGMMGFEGTTALAHEMEQRLDEARMKTRHLAARDLAAMLEAFDALRRLNASVEAVGDEASADVSRELALVAAIGAVEAGPADDLFARLDPYDQMAVLVCAAKNIPVLEIRRVGPAGWPADLAAVGEVLAVWGPDGPVGSPADVPAGPGAALLGADRAPAEAAAALGLAPGEWCPAKLPGMPAGGPGWPSEPVAPAAAAPALAAPPLAAPPASSPTTAAPAQEVTAERASSVRVETARLDRLMELIGELVIHRTRVSRLSADLKAMVAAPGPLDERRGGLTELTASLEDAMQAVDRVSDELQDVTMRVRMVPVRTVFDRFPRIIRDLARTCGKAARLETSGADTELDKTVIEQIADPLVHLLRNAVDHGLEPPDERVAAGKPAEGCVSLAAAQQGPQIVITVAEDGRGIDLDRVLAKARALGWVRPDETPADADLLQLIFRPGFSTAASVTAISGRGVGMDVVRQNIERLGGRIHVFSEAGRGTRFEVRLPLTLAIAKALLVQAGAHTYAIPLAVVEETRRVAPDELRTINGSEILDLRGAVVPVVRLARLLHRGCTQAAGGFLPAIVVNDGQRRMALIVDALVGQQDVVVKPLGEFLGQIPGVGGATILGDGRVALIVDVPTLVARPGTGAGSPVLA